jgi:peroxin-5
LELNSGFIRARYNLGVSCINIGCYKEAAEHFLTALNLHATINPHQRNISNNLWDTLRRTFVIMNRRDLAEKVKNHDVNVFHDEFEF